MAQFNNLSAGIVAMLKTLTSINSAYVLDYATSSLPGYPAITVTAADQTAIVGDTSRNERTYTFSVKVYLERTKSGESASESTMRGIVDDIITLFDSNRYLDGRLSGIGWVRPVPSAWRYAQGEQIDLRIAEILLQATVIE